MGIFVSDPKTFVTKTDGAGQSVSVSLGSGFREAGLLIGALIIALVFSCALAIVAFIEAREAKAELALNTYFLQRLIVHVDAAGIKHDPAPFESRK